MGRQFGNNDSRWSWVDRLSDLLAILQSIETNRRYIWTHATQADMHNVVLNLLSIQKEAESMSEEIEKLKRLLGGMQADLVREIRSPNGDLLVELAQDNGSFDRKYGYYISETQRGVRFRRVRLSDYQ